MFLIGKWIQEHFEKISWDARTFRNVDISPEMVDIQTPEEAGDEVK